MLKKFFLTYLISSAYGLAAQQVNPPNNVVFLQDEVASFKVYVDPTYLANMLNQDSLESNNEYPAYFIYKTSTFTDTIDSVGFRLRGNTSRYAQKKSFKLSMNTFIQGRKWHGLEKINLNGEHNDPSILRSYLSANLLQVSNVPVARNSYVKLFINDEYKGLYFNTEHIDEQFIQSRFPNDDSGNLYKASWGANLNYLGTNPSNYSNWYELKTNTTTNNITGLINFLSVLNNTATADFPCAIQAVFDVDSYLKTMAIEILAGHWDGHAYNKNNFFLYQRPSDGRFVFIEYDMDNTFGIDWSGINWATRPIYTWSNTSEMRPLYTRIMAVPYFKDKFSFYMQEALATFYNQSDLINVLETKQALISTAALDDDYKGYDYDFTDNDFLNAITQTWGSHVTSSISTFIVNRVNSATNQLVYTSLTNPCPLGIEELKPTLFVPIKAFNMQGQEVPLSTKNQLIYLQSADGQLRKSLTIE